MEITEKGKAVICVAVGLLIMAGYWFFFPGRNDVSDIGQRADETRNELDSAREEQRDQAESLERATDAADRGQQAVRDSQETAGKIQDLERSDTEIIRECKSILRDIRERSEAQGSSKN